LKQPYLISFVAVCNGCFEQVDDKLLTLAVSYDTRYAVGIGRFVGFRFQRNQSFYLSCWRRRCLLERDDGESLTLLIQLIVPDRACDENGENSGNDTDGLTADQGACSRCQLTAYFCWSGRRRQSRTHDLLLQILRGFEW